MEAWREELYSDELYHFGILGQKKGVRNGPPYPLGAGDHSAAEKRKNGGLLRRMAERRAEKKKKKKQQERIQKMQAAKQAKVEAKKKQEADEAERKRVLKEGSAEEVMKYKGKISNEEYQEVMARLDNERKMESYLADKGKEAANAGLNKVGNEPVPKVETRESKLKASKEKWNNMDNRERIEQVSKDTKMYAEAADNVVKAAKSTVNFVNAGISIYNAYALGKGMQQKKHFAVNWK